MGSRSERQDRFPGTARSLVELTRSRIGLAWLPSKLNRSCDLSSLLLKSFSRGPSMLKPFCDSKITRFWWAEICTAV